MPGDFLAFSIQIIQGAQRFARSVDALGSEFRQDVARDRQNLHGLAAAAPGAQQGPGCRCTTWCHRKLYLSFQLGVTIS